VRGFVPTVLAFFLTLGTLFALTGYQITSETAGTRLLGRLGGALIEIDRWLPAHGDDLQLLASDRRQGRLHPADIPIDVTLTASDLGDSSDEALRHTLLNAMGRVLYTEGAGGFRDAQGQEGSLAIDEPVHWTATSLSEGAHHFWEAALPLTLLLLVASLAGVLLSGRSPLPILLTSTLLAALGSFGTWLLAEALSDVLSAPTDREIMLIVRDGAWIALRDSLAVSAVLATLLLLNSMLTRHREEPWPYDPGPFDDASTA
jgi:hypothetical protein